jgi:hypothetical protein
MHIMVTLCIRLQPLWLSYKIQKKRAAHVPDINKQINKSVNKRKKEKRKIPKMGDFGAYNEGARGLNVADTRVPRRRTPPRPHPPFSSSAGPTETISNYRFSSRRRRPPERTCKSERERERGGGSHSVSECQEHSGTCAPPFALSSRHRHFTSLSFSIRHSLFRVPASPQPWRQGRSFQVVFEGGEEQGAAPLSGAVGREDKREGGREGGSGEPWQRGLRMWAYWPWRSTFQRVSCAR